MTAHFLFHCWYLFFLYSVYWIEWWILSDCHIIRCELKTIFDDNIMLTLKRCSETDTVVTQENRHPRKFKLPNYQEYWSSENCTFKGCPFRVTKFLLLNIKLLKHWIMVVIISARDGVLIWSLFVCHIFGERGFPVVNVTETLICPKLLEWLISPLCR